MVQWPMTHLCRPRASVYFRPWELVDVGCAWVQALSRLTWLCQRGSEHSSTRNWLRWLIVVDIGFDWLRNNSDPLASRAVSLKWWCEELGLTTKEKGRWKNRATFCWVLACPCVCSILKDHCTLLRTSSSTGCELNSILKNHWSLSPARVFWSPWIKSCELV